MPASIHAGGGAPGTPAGFGGGRGGAARANPAWAASKASATSARTLHVTSTSPVHRRVTVTCAAARTGEGSPERGAEHGSMRAIKLPIAAFVAAACSASPAWASELIARNATDVRLEVNQAGTGAALLSRQGQAAPRARLGSDERGAFGVRAAAGDVPPRLLGRLGRVPPAGVEDVRERLRAGAARPALARRCVPRSRRLVLGRAELAADASRVRHARRPRPRRVGAAALALVGAAAEARGAVRLDVPPLPSDLRPADVSRPRGLRLRPHAEGRTARRLRPEHLRRHARLRVRPGLAAGERLPHAPARREGSATGSTRTATGRQAAACATAPR